MSRLDPLRERQDFCDAIQAGREPSLDLEKGLPDRHAVPSSGPSRADRSEPERPRSDVGFDNSRAVLYDRDHGYRLRASEVHTLVDLGKFRIVAAGDLATHAYAGRRKEMQNDLRSLLRQGLVQKGMFDGAEHTPRELLTLTKRGFRLLRANPIVPEGQAIYCGFVQLREANHDADLYNLYQKEHLRILEQGGRNPRVILDFELKRKINRDLAKIGRAARPEIAEHHGLRVVRGRIPVPDVRIEYELPDGVIARVDLELVTEHYRRQGLADKVQAGFSLYTPRGESDRLRRVLDAHELTAEILSL